MTEKWAKKWAKCLAKLGAVNAPAPCEPARTRLFAVVAVGLTTVPFLVCNQLLQKFPSDLNLRFISFTYVLLLFEVHSPVDNSVSERGHGERTA